MSTVPQQASAVEAAVRVLAGSAVKPSAKEREYLVQMLRDAAVTLRGMEAS